MKQILFVFLLLVCSNVFSQPSAKQEIHDLTYLLSNTVFGSKDSVTLEKIFDKQLTYGHSKGKIENRSQAIRGIVSNLSQYSDTAIKNISIALKKHTAVVRYQFTAMEKKNDGSSASLNLNILLVRTKNKKEWKLLARQAVAIL